MPLLEQDVGVAIRDDGVADPLILWTTREALRIGLHHDVVIENNVRQHELHFVCGKVTSRAAKGLAGMRQTRRTHSPGVSSLAEGDEIGGRADEASSTINTDKPPWVEDRGIGVVDLVQMSGRCGC